MNQALSHSACGAEPGLISVDQALQMLLEQTHILVAESLPLARALNRYLAEKIDSAYKSYRWQVFLGIFIGYAGFYIVSKNFSMAIPELAQFGFEKGELSIVLSMNAVAYALSKFLMGSVSDRSNARVFLPLGLVLAAVSIDRKSVV